MVAVEALKEALALPGIFTARGQLLVSRQRLRQDLYDRSVPIYIAFHELLEAVGKSAIDADEAIQKVHTARRLAPLLLGPKLVPLLSELFNEALRLHETAKLLRNGEDWSSKLARWEAGKQFPQDVLRFLLRTDELEKQFRLFLDSSTLPWWRRWWHRNSAVALTA